MLAWFGFEILACGCQEIGGSVDLPCLKQLLASGRNPPTGQTSRQAEI